jgi:hypothetical protein
MFRCYCIVSEQASSMLDAVDVQQELCEHASLHAMQCLYAQSRVGSFFIISSIRYFG